MTGYLPYTQKVTAMRFTVQEYRTAVTLCLYSNLTLKTKCLMTTYGSRWLGDPIRVTSLEYRDGLCV